MTMPELPEVETVKNQLIPEVIGKTIIETTQSGLNLRGKALPDLSLLKGQTILNIERRNKYLILNTVDFYLIIHLGMTGQLLIAPTLPMTKHIHATFTFKDKVLYYQDARRFGRVDVYAKTDYKSTNSIPSLSNLGIEPLDASFNIDTLFSLIDGIKNKKISSKNFIMDGKFICGIGNIYACEILFLSHINPLQTLQTLTTTQITALHSNIKSVLLKAIEMGGSTISDFMHLNGTAGKMQDFYHVYGRENQPCHYCSNPIVRIKQNGRSTFFCTTCQHN